MNINSQDDAVGMLGKIIASFIAILLIAGTLWTLWQLLLGGLNWISSGGDKGKLEEAQGRIRNALIGIFILFSSWAMFLLVLRVLGIIGDAGFQINLPTVNQ